MESMSRSISFLLNSVTFGCRRFVKLLIKHDKIDVHVAKTSFIKSGLQWGNTRAERKYFFFTCEHSDGFEAPPVNRNDPVCSRQVETNWWV